MASEKDRLRDKARAKSEKRRLSNERYRKKHAEKLALKTKAWVARNPEKLKAQNLKRYGITLEEYQRMWEEQNGVCAICLEPEKTGRNLSVDHDHATGKVRSLLCNGCNNTLGYSREDLVILEQAIAYLKKHRI